MDNKLSNPGQTVFEQIKKLDQSGNEYWTARDLSKILEYSEYRHFKPAIDRAREACKNSGHPVVDHFEDILGMVTIGSGAEREIDDVNSPATLATSLCKMRILEKRLWPWGKPIFGCSNPLVGDTTVANLSATENRRRKAPFSTQGNV